MAVQISSACRSCLFTTNRDKLWESLETNDVVLLLGAADKFRNADTEREFRQDSDFMYFCLGLGFVLTTSGTSQEWLISEKVLWF